MKRMHNNRLLKLIIIEKIYFINIFGKNTESKEDLMLSKKAQYSLYALIKLAKEADRGPILIKEIAESERLPKKFLETILLELKNLGIVSSKKGKGGGYYLRKKPEDIDLAFIVRNFDGALAYLPCVSANYYERCEHCIEEDKCGLRSVFSDVRAETARILQNTTIADIIKREEELLIK